MNSYRGTYVIGKDHVTITPLSRTFKARQASATAPDHEYLRAIQGEHPSLRTERARRAPRLRTHLAIVIAGLTGMLGLLGCGSPSATARACGAKAKLDASVSAWRGFNFTNPSAPKLADAVSSMASPLKAAEAGVPLPQNSRLRQLGGVSYLRQLNRELQQTAQQLRSAPQSGQEQLVFDLRPTITTQAGQVQQVADGITGC